MSGDVKGKLLIEMSTVPPKVELELAPKVRAKGASLVECPVGGTTGPAREGKLLGLIGGKRPMPTRAQPVLEQFAARSSIAGRSAPARR